MNKKKPCLLKCSELEAEIGRGLSGYTDRPLIVTYTRAGHGSISTVIVEVAGTPPKGRAILCVSEWDLSRWTANPNDEGCRTPYGIYVKSGDRFKHLAWNTRLARALIELAVRRLPTNC